MLTRMPDAQPLDGPGPLPMSAHPPLRQRQPEDVAQEMLWRLYARVRGIDADNLGHCRPPVDLLGASVMAELIVAGQYRRHLGALVAVTAGLLRAAETCVDSHRQLVIAVDERAAMQFNLEVAARAARGALDDLDQFAPDVNAG